MQFGGATSIVLLLVAVLWIAYVVPGWVRRRNYLATEQNAVRLQQTLRAMAETAEAPRLDRVEMSSRGVAEQQRRLRAARKAAAKAEREREEAARRDLPRVRAPRTAAGRRAAIRTLQRRRRMCSLFGLCSLLVLLAGVPVGLMSGNWWPTTAGVVGLLAALALLVRLSRVESAQRAAFARSRRQAAPTEPVAVQQQRRSRERAPRPAVETLLEDEPEQAVAGAEELPDEVELAGWTPVPVPPPLYITRATFEAEPVGAEGPEDGPDGPDGGPDGPGGGHDDFSERVLAALHEEARRNEQAIRDAHRQPGVATFGRPARGPVLACAEQPVRSEQERPAAARPDVEEQPPAAVPGPWAAMGVIGEQQPGMGDLDEVLQRRRAG
ncbi:MAG: hypothetical protein Q4E05_05635 [Pseudoclavibacter sp.]|nr:hypothetical protein [Pseudoclavibacter sp.]